jgi:hypothetical protein
MKQYRYYKANGHPAPRKKHENKDLFKSGKNAILYVSHTMKNMIIGFYGFWPSCGMDYKDYTPLRCYSV